MCKVAADSVKVAALFAKVAAHLVELAALLGKVAALFLKNTKNNGFFKIKSVIVTSKATTFELKWAIVAVLP